MTVTSGVRTGSANQYQANQSLVRFEIIAPPARSKNLGDCHRRHRHPIGYPLRFKLVARSFPDHQIDQFESLGLVNRFRQQLPITIAIVTHVLLAHRTPRRTRCPTASTVSQRKDERNGFTALIPTARILVRECCRIDRKRGRLGRLKC